MGLRRSGAGRVRRGTSMRFGTRLAIFFWVSTISMSALTLAYLYRDTASVVRGEAEARLTTVALGAAHLVDPDLHRKIESQKDRSRTAYRAIERRLQAFLASNHGVRRVYTLVRTPDPDQVRFVVNVGAGPPGLAQTGGLRDVRKHPEILQAFKSATAQATIRRDDLGTWLSGYAPVKDGQGKVVAVLGLDVSADDLLRLQGNIRLSAALWMLTAVVLTTILSLALSSSISKPLQQLTLAACHIAEGNLDYSIPADSKDEIGSLAASLNRMAASVRENQASLLQRANTDGLTGLYNHRYFHERLGQEMKRALRYNHSLSLMMMDLDGFKAVNDTLGHPAGDTILRNFAKLLLSEIRDIDVPARYGGDEFAVILPETGVDEAREIAERVREAVDRRPHLTDEPLSADRGEYGSPSDWKITLSVGVAECPTHALQKDALVAAADIAMYHAKHVSQNAVCSYDNVPGAGSTMDPCRIHTFLQSASVSTIAALAAAVDAKDHYTRGHSEAVARYSVGIATELRLPTEDRFNVRIAALLHDVGKIGMPDTILNNPGQLDTHERDIVRSHPSVGERIVKQVPQLQKILPGILYHHERYDGTGYPCGLSGDRIPLIARIICVADSFDAMTSNRPYRSALTVDQALAELQACKGTQFDPPCVDAFIRWLRSAELQAA